MRKAVILTFFLLWFLQSSGQKFPHEIWYEGEVTLDSQQTVKGLIKYDFDNDAIQVNVDNLIKTYSARKFSYFEIFSPQENSQRLFYSLPYRKISDYEVPTVFELIAAGKKLSLLAREIIVMESVPQYDFYSSSSYYYNRTRLYYNFFFLFPTGKIKEYRIGKKELLYIMKDKSDLVKRFMKENRLKYDVKSDLIKIVEYYNSI